LPSFTGTQPGLQQIGPIIQVTLSVVEAADQAMRAAGQTPPSPIQVAMMIDTGASSSMIEPGLASRLGLNPVGVQQVVTPTTTAPVSLPTYAARITLATGPVFETTVMEAPLVGQAINGLIGRDVLAQCVLIYIGYANQFTLAV
jgi:predicted aspartyl protease